MFLKHGWARPFFKHGFDYKSDQHSFYYIRLLKVIDKNFHHPMHFYKKVYKAKRKELLQISREVASANDKDKINDYISCLHVSWLYGSTTSRTCETY